MKFYEVRQIYSQTIENVSQSEDNWIKFLKCASHNFKYSFDNQILIYAQKPNSIACAEMQEWNDKVKPKRWVNKGTAGIAIFAKEDSPLPLRFVFDLTDTHNYMGTQYHLWKVEEKYQTEIIEALENKFGGDFANSSFEQAIFSSTFNMVEDNITDYITEIIENKKGSRLEKLSDSEIEALTKTFVWASVAYMTLNRCGINANDKIDKKEFSILKYFNSTKLITTMGTAISDIAETGLREIALTIRNLKLEEIRQNRTFVKSDIKDYYNNIINEKGGIEDGETRIQTSRGLSNTKYNNEKENITNREIRNNEIELSERTQKRRIYNAQSEQYSSRTFGGDSEQSNRNDRTNNEEIAGEREYNRGIESTRPDEVGRLNEQLQDDSRGTSGKGDNLQLKTRTDYIKNSEIPEIQDKDLIKEIIRNAPNISNKITEINKFINENEKDVEKCKQYVNKLFGEAYTEFIIKNDVKVGYKTFNNGVDFWTGNYLTRNADSLINWDSVTDNFITMVNTGEIFLDKTGLLDEQEQIDNIIQAEVTNASVFSFTQEMIDSVLREGNQIQNGKFEIYKNLSKNLGSTENANYLKKVYGIGGRSADEFGNSMDYNSKGILLSRGYEDNSPKYLLNWLQAEKRIRQLISDDRYLNNKEKEEYKKWSEKNESVIENIEETKENATEENYIYKIGDNVFLGNEEYEITNVTDKQVTLADIKFPLFAKQLSYEEFDKKAKENPFNDHLKESNRADVVTDIPKIEENNPSEVVEIKEKITDEIPNIEIKDTKLEIPKIKTKRKNKIEYFDLHPEIPISERNNYEIIDNNLGEGSKKEKYKRNIEAIKILKKCDEENRYATPEEQEKLAQYVGWGGIPEAFDSRKDEWLSEYNELKELLTEKEYKEAKSSTLTAFYTPPVVIKSIYKALKKMGLERGNILEPSCGVGNFFGLLPKELAECKMYGVEIDSISGGIARQLYQKNTIAIKGFEEVEMPDAFFDVAIGNVPFGDYKLADKRYDKNKFLIHDYFFAKALDKVRPNGIIAFITSKGTLDKDNDKVRRYISQRAELIGAIRLPNNTFKKNANTIVTSDIIFLKKRDKLVDLEDDWVELSTNENGIKMNKYFVDNPNMVLGKMETCTTQFGIDTTCNPNYDISLEEQLDNAIENITAQIEDYQIDNLDEQEEISIPASSNVRNFSYTIVENQVYFRENSRMYLQDLPVTSINRIKGMIEIRDSLRTLIELQTDDGSDEEIKIEQTKLSRLYDSFTKKYGIINSKSNERAFSQDDSYFLLCSLEVLDKDREFVRKADMFYKRTIKPNKQVSKADSAIDALILSVAEKACVDLEYMSKLTGKEKEQLIKELEGSIYKDPMTKEYVTSDEYLSGNVRQKLRIAQEFAQNNKEYEINVKALERVKIKDLSASEISVRLGATWIPASDIEEFIFDLLKPSYYVQSKVKVHYSDYTSEWNIANKSEDRYNVKSYNTYGTSRINAYKIIEQTLNLKDVRIFDTVIDIDGNEKKVLNKKETAIAQSKQEIIKNKFIEWIWKDQERRERLVTLYNEKFNNIKPREFDGQYIKFGGINPEITLRKHQVNAIARILYGKNVLLAHEVGAGKTFEMVAGAMESKRIGLCNKSLFVVPNHIIEQFASEFLQLYPSANLLVTTKKDFAMNNRKKFISKIATGEYDAIIIGHSQFEKIPISKERQEKILERQINEMALGIEDLRNNDGEYYSIKQLEKSKKKIEERLKKLNDQANKDSLITFEQLGVDRLFVDEAHYFKNLFLYTKMRNVSGIAQTEAQKSSDLFMKCQYIDELTDGKGITFATGTPISNSMVELYTMQRYLQYQTLKESGLLQFDSWASTFGETANSIELNPEGTGYRSKTRFAKFYNLPELMALFKEVADVQTADTLNLPTPEAVYKTIVAKPSDIQVEMVQNLAERAERIRKGEVNAQDDNMLIITNEGRKLALDQRLINEMLPDFENSKVNLCVNNLYEIYDKTKQNKSTQLVFCDLSTPKGDGKFNVYDDIKQKLISKGVNEDEIAFIHDATNENKKKELFAKVRSGDVRVLIGSTSKMGAGTNVQQKLVAIHHLDCPWRPADLTQRNGRGIRQGNENSKIEIFTYVTERTFDAYLYQLIQNKLKFITQIMTSKAISRSEEDIDEKVLSVAEVKALAAGNPLIIEKTQLEADVAKLKLLKQSYLSQVYNLEDLIAKFYPKKIKELQGEIETYKKDIVIRNNNTQSDNEEKFSPMIIAGKIYTNKENAGTELIEQCKNKKNMETEEIGEYRGFKMSLKIDLISREFSLELKGNATHTVNLGTDKFGNITRIDNVLADLEKRVERKAVELKETERQLETAKNDIEIPFNQESELQEKTKKLDNINIMLNLDEKDNELMDDDEVQEEKTPEENKSQDYDRKDFR